MSTPPSSIVSLDEVVGIRPLTSTDLPSIRDIHKSTLPIPHSPAFYRQFLIHCDRLCLVAYPAEAEDTPIAFVSASISVPRNDLKSSSSLLEPHVQILTLGVLPEYRRSGIGRRLLQEVIFVLRSSITASASNETVVSAHVCVLDEGARNFYNSVGLHEREVVRNVFRSNSIPPKARDAFVVVGRVR